MLENNLEELSQAMAIDDTINQLGVEIDQASVRYITLRSPVSIDVRFILVAIKASHDLERAGDEAEKIALQTRKILTKDGVFGETAAIAEMSKITGSMMKDAITALIEEDIELAREVIARDKKVNKLNKENFKFLSVSPESDKSENSTHFQKIFISKSIERIADHAKNLAEEVIYLLTGTQHPN